MPLTPPPWYLGEKDEADQRTIYGTEDELVPGRMGVLVARFMKRSDAELAVLTHQAMATLEMLIGYNDGVGSHADLPGANALIKSSYLTSARVLVSEYARLKRERKKII